MANTISATVTFGNITATLSNVPGTYGNQRYGNYTATMTIPGLPRPPAPFVPAPGKPIPADALILPGQVVATIAGDPSPVVIWLDPPTGTGATPKGAAVAAATALYGATGGGWGSFGVSGISIWSMVQMLLNAFSEAGGV